MSYRIQFPHFDPATMPEMPANWGDISWHNDACPMFKVGNFQVCIDFENPAERAFAELEECSRFVVALESNGEIQLETDVWAEVLEFVK